MKRVVIDANIIISAAFGGLPLEAVQHAARCDIFISSAIEQELVGVMDKLSDKLPVGLFGEAKRQIEMVIKNAEKVKIGKSIEICRDPKDNTYLETAKTANADILITGDKDLLSLSFDNLEMAGLEKLKIMSPRDFVDEML